MRKLVSARLYGGLGNRMFQTAAAIGYAEEHGLQYTKFATMGKLVKEKSHSYHPLPAPDKQDSVPVLLDGYFQSEKYFEHCADKIRRHFEGEHCYNRRMASIHVRRGDYLLYPTKHPVITIEYLRKAVMFLIERGVVHFRVFSDDLAWCSENFTSSNDVRFEIMPITFDWQDMLLMSRCEHNIISNSTFSWWGAWLNPNPDKLVISPSAANWFGPDNAHLDTKDIIPDNWLQIKY